MFSGNSEINGKYPPIRNALNRSGFAAIPIVRLTSKNWCDSGIVYFNSARDQNRCVCETMLRSPLKPYGPEPVRNVPSYHAESSIASGDVMLGSRPP